MATRREARDDVPRYLLDRNKRGGWIVRDMHTDGNPIVAGAFESRAAALAARAALGDDTATDDDETE